MRVSRLIFTVMTLLASLILPVQLLRAQDDCGDECKLNTNLAMVLNAPVHPTSQVLGMGWGIVGGAGYNFNRRHAIIGEFMWNRAYASSGALQPFQTALQSRDISGNTDFYALTGNYRFELRGHLTGVYLIGGGGWYYRNTWISKEVAASIGTVCSPSWLWWGYTCTSGTVTANQTHRISSSNSLGGNAGVGLTVRVGEAPYRFYTEARYHYAPTKNISTQFIAVTVGIRF
jgi:hypothetical protein